MKSKSIILVTVWYCNQSTKERDDDVDDPDHGDDDFQDIGPEGD